jgi:hypothetical protein
MSRTRRRAYDERDNEISPLTLGSMHSMGIRSVDACCEAIRCCHQATDNVDSLPDERSPIRHRLVLHRIGPSQGIRRFNSLMVEQDLFGIVLLVSNWRKDRQQGPRAGRDL